MVQYILKPAWMKKIQLGICADSIHPDNGRAVFVYCNSLSPQDPTNDTGLRPRYAIEFGSLFPHLKTEISDGVFVVSEGHTDQLSFYGDDMFPDSFQTAEEVFLYAKNKVFELEKQLQEIQVNTAIAMNAGVSYVSVKIALAAWKCFVEQLAKALRENSVDSFTSAIPD
jgi:hypothetical protein